MEGLRQRGHGQWLASPAGTPLAETMRQRGFTVTGLGSPGRSLATAKTLRHIAPEFDILHAHDAHAHTLAWLASAARGQRAWPCLVVSRRVAFSIGKFGGMKYAAADAYIAVSDFVSRKLVNVQVPAAKIHVVYDGVMMPPAAAPGMRREFRSRFGVSDRAPLIGTFTSLAPEKRLQEQLDLLEALPHSTHLWIGHPAADPGQREIRDTFLGDAKKRGLGDRFRILALDDDVEPFFDSLDVFLYLSRSEGLGSAILLAMAHALPVVASRVGGIPEIVHHKETGLLVGDHPAEDAIKEELFAAVSLLLDSEQLRAELGAAGRRFVLENATTEVMVQNTAAVYQEILQAVPIHSDRRTGEGERG